MPIRRQNIRIKTLLLAPWAVKPTPLRRNFFNVHLKNSLAPAETRCFYTCI